MAVDGKWLALGVLVALGGCTTAPSGLGPYVNDSQGCTPTSSNPECGNAFAETVQCVETLGDRDCYAVPQFAQVTPGCTREEIQREVLKISENRLLATTMPDLKRDQGMLGQVRERQQDQRNFIYYCSAELVVLVGDRVARRPITYTVEAMGPGPQYLVIVGGLPGPRAELSGMSMAMGEALDLTPQQIRNLPPLQGRVDLSLKDKVPADQPLNDRP